MVLVQAIDALILIQLPDNVSGKAADQGPCAWAPMWELREKLLIPGFDLGQPQPLQSLGSEPADGSTLFFSL